MLNNKLIFMRNLFLFFGVLICLSSCDDADIASSNLSRDADNFKIYRRVVFYNGITGEYILTIEGYSSINDSNGQLEVTMKVGENKYVKHFLGLSDNVTYFSEQLESSKVSTDHYKITFKPSVILPTIESR